MLAYLRAPEIDGRGVVLSLGSKVRDKGIGIVLSIKDLENDMTFNQYGHYVGQRFPDECIEECSASGRVDESVEYWQKKLSFHVPRERAIKWLAETGGWTREELGELDNDNIARKVLWLACCDIKESGEWFGLTN